MTLSTTATTDVATKTKRAYAARQPKWQRFQTSLMVPSSTSAASKQSKSTCQKQQPKTVEQHPYQRQYAHVYHQRMAILGPRCWETMTIPKDDNQRDVFRAERILELKENVPSVVVGTLVKEQAPDSHKQEPLHPDSRCKASDTLYLEDESGRVALETDQPHAYCTGVVIGVHGTVRSDGVLVVQQFYVPRPAPAAVASPDSSTNETIVAPHLMLISGLHCGGSTVSLLPRDMLLSFLQGRFGTDVARKVCRVIVAGGCITPERNDEQQQHPTVDSDTLTCPTRELDGFLLQMTSSGIPLDVMPGKYDPTTANWPQRPLHHALVNVTHRIMGRLESGTGLLVRTPNPYAATMQPERGGDGDKKTSKHICGTDGANVQDLVRNLLLKHQGKNDNDKEEMEATTAHEPVEELHALQKTLEWGHMCPTGPSSVPTMPHATGDPMVLDTWPDLYFAGNCNKFATKTVWNHPPSNEEGHDEGRRACRLVCIPKFADSGEAVLVNLLTMEVEIVRFED